jgi:adenylate cyclase
MRALPRNYTHGFTLRLPQIAAACGAPAIALALVAVLGALGALGSLDRAWFDFLQRKTAARAPLPDHTALVLIDENSMRVLGRDPYGYRWPWPRDAFTGLIASLHRAGAKAVALDLIFFEQSEDQMQDYMLGAIAAGIPEATLGAMPAGEGKPEQLPVVWSADFREANADCFAGRPRWGYVKSVPDEDSVIRRYVATNALASVVAPELWAPEGKPLLRWRGNLEQLRARGVPVVSASYFAVDGLAVMKCVTDTVPDLDRAAMVRAIEAAPAPTDALVKDAFAKVRGCTVCVGVNAASTFDFIATPCGAPEPGVVSHWTAYANLSAGGFLRETGPWASVGLLSLVLTALGRVSRGGIGIGRPALVAAAVRCSRWAGARWRFSATSGSRRCCGGWRGSGVRRGGGAQFPAGEGAEEGDPGLVRQLRLAAVVKQLVQNPDSLKLGGEKRELTIFFADLANFTTLSESMPPEELVPLINSVLEDLTRACSRTAATSTSTSATRSWVCSAARAAGEPRALGLPGGAGEHATAGQAQRADRADARQAPRHAHRREHWRCDRGQRRFDQEAQLHRARRCGEPRFAAGGREQGVPHGNPDRPEDGGTARRRAGHAAGGAAEGEGQEAGGGGVRVDRRAGLARRGRAAVPRGVRRGLHGLLPAAVRGGVPGIRHRCDVAADDFLATRYAEETQRLADSPPPSDWEPILELHTK